LSTALRHLKPPHRIEAVTLLAQVLQEQGAWGESLQLLDDEVSLEDSSKGHLCETLRLMARVHQYGLEPVEMHSALTYLHSVTMSEEPVETRILAARVAAHLIGDLRAPTVAHRMLDAVSAIPLTNLTAEDLAKIALIKAILLYQLQERQSSLHEIEAAAVHLRSQNLASTIACQLQAGLGAIKCLEGQYAEALEFLQNAHRIATRLDNDTLRRDVTANIALAHGRLGNYEHESRWAKESMGLGPTALTSYVQILACYCAAFASAVRGSTQEAAELLSALERRMPGTLPPWAVQAWRLYSADVLHIAGKGVEARRAALRATVEQEFRLHAPGFAGPFARWIAVLSESPERLGQASIEVDRLLAKIRSYDAIDRAEILAASVMLNRKQAKSVVDGERMLREALQALPEAVSSQLRRLGFL
jgi:tetratricopeptide (TPR) repeat protein